MTLSATKAEAGELLKAPFPWFGGKSRVASLVWERFGDVANYVEPFAGSLAVLLGRPHEAKVETVNDKDAFLCNFWRAIAYAPEETARWADWPVSEPDLIARHRWLMATGLSRVELCRQDPEFYDAKVAGWWVWGLCSWIGAGWCAQRGNGDQPEQIPHLGDAGRGINRKLPHLGDAGREAGHAKRPHLMNGGGKGINADRGDIYAYFQVLHERLRGVRVCCGDWTRVLGESVTIKNGTTGVFLDPPYSAAERADCYAVETDCADAVREWAIANGNNHELRISLCGYEGEHTMPADWDCVPWKARGGYGSQADGRGRENSAKERIWFSPYCEHRQPNLFKFNQSERCATITPGLPI